MKQVAILCLLPVIFYSQTPERQARNTQLQIEWQHDLSKLGTPETVTDIVLSDELIFTSLRGENGSRLLIYDPRGTEKSVIQEKSFIQNLQMLNKHLYSMGGCQLIARNSAGNISFETCLKLQENWTLSAVDGEIMGSGAYALHWAKMIAAYDLSGQMKWSKQIGELSDNKFLKAGGGKIYVFAKISNPNLGSRLLQYDTLGNQKWSVPVGDVRAMLADEEGNCYVAPVEVESTLIKYNTAGQVVWSKPVKGQFIEGMSKRGDSIFVCGRLKLGSPENQLCAYSIFSAKTGEILKQQSFSIYQPATVSEHFSHIVSDGENIYIGGVYGAQSKTCFLVKLSREGNTTGLKDEKVSPSSFNIFPNPGGSKFTISCGDTKVASLQVTVRNVEGKVVYSKEIHCNADNSITLDLGNQAAGNYTIDIKSDHDRVTKKIVVQ